MTPKWYVMTGGPCCGKTTLMTELKQLGYHIVDEAARTLIDQEMAKGKTLAQIRKNEKKFQQRVLDMKIATEASLPKSEIVFLDRGIPDTTAYYEFIGFSGDTALREAEKKSVYRRIFLLDLLPFESDYARTESEEEAKRIHHLLEKAYRTLGFDVVSVPILPVEERLQFILQRL